MNPIPSIPVDSVRAVRPLLVACSESLRNIATVLLLVGSAAAQAQDTGATGETVTLDTFRVTTDVGKYAEQSTTAGAKVPTAVKDQPFTVQIFNANLINDHLAATLDDIYPYVTGMIRETKDVTGFNVRGFTASAGGSLQNLMYDGLPGISTKFGSPGISNVDRVEVVKGPTSILYGRLTPGGMINVVTKSPMATQQTSIRTILSTYDTGVSGLGSDVSLTATIDSTGPLDKAKHWLYRVIASGESVHDFRKANWARNWALFPSLTYQPSKDTSFTVKIDLVKQYRRSDDFLTVPPFNNPANVPSFDVVYQDPQDRDGDAGYGISTVFKHHFANDWNLTFATRNIYHWDDRKAFRSNANAVDVISATPVENSTVTRFFQYKFTAREFNFFDLNAYRDFGPDNFKHTILIGTGGGMERSDVNFFQNASSGSTVSLVNVYNPVLGLTPYPDTSIPIANSDPVQHAFGLAGYISDHVKIGDRWHAVLGWRYDHEHATYYDGKNSGLQRREANKGAGVPQGGLLFNVTSGFSVYANYSESFKPQSVRGQVDTTGEPYPPETGNQFEAGFKFQTADTKVTATVAAYDITKQNVLESTGGSAPNGLPLGQIVGEQESKGIETDVIWLPVPNWQVSLGYTYVDAKITKTVNPALLDKPFVNVPHNAGNLWTRYNFTNGGLKGLGLGFGAIMQGARWGGNTVSQTSAFIMPGYTRFDTAVFYQKGRYTLSLNINNVTDKKYLFSTGNSALFPGEPRKISLNASVKF